MHIFSTTQTALLFLLPLSLALPQTTPRCLNGQLQCCNSVGPANSLPVSQLLGLLGIVIPDPRVNVGLTCSPCTAFLTSEYLARHS